MANTLVLPSGGPITDREFAALEPAHRKRLLGYGTIEVIGGEYAPYVIPFIRDRGTHQTEVTFWTIPGVAYSGGGVAVPTHAPRHYPIPIVTYAEPAEKRRKKNPSTKPPTVPAKRTVPTRAAWDDEDDDVLDLTQPQIPETWATPFAEAKVGCFAMIESTYARGKRGVSLVKVLPCHMRIFPLFLLQVTSVENLALPDQDPIYKAVEWNTSNDNRNPLCIRF